MPSETGLVDNIKPRDKTYSVAVNNQWFGGFGKCPVNKGETVTIDWKQKGEFKNITKIQAIKPAQAIEKPNNQTKRTDPLAEDIHLQVCLKATATLHAGSKATPKEIADYTKELMTELWA